MYLAILNLSILLHQALDRLSPLDTGVFVLFTSFVCHLGSLAFSDPPT